jgi:Ni/Co efflux regulator RcnB
MGVSQMKRAISQKRRKQRIVKCRNSGVPVKEWCWKQGISYSTYYRHDQA